jgi:arylsulfatase A-like enzyme
MWWTLLAACTGDSDKQRPDPVDPEPTDTYPQFLGRVPKNIVMISIDTFRRDHLDRYADGSRERAPFLSALADEGVTLDDHVQCSNWTFASMSCTLSGRYNEESSMIPRLSEVDARPWPTGTDFLAGYLGEVGFYSVAVSTNGWFGPEWNGTEGYDQAYVADTGSAWGAYQQARATLDAARADGRADGPWMLHVHTVEPHAPYDPPLQYLGEVAELPPAPWDLSNRDIHYEERNEYLSLSPEEQELLRLHLEARYRAEIRHLDDEILDIVNDLRADRLLDDTLLVFWTDHGEQFWEHGNQTHAFSLFREENDALLFFWSDNIVPSAWEGPTTSVDLVPTMAKLYGFEAPADLSGIPLGEAPEDRARFATSVARLGPASSVQKNGWKMIFSWYGYVKLYDLNTDPGELVDLYDPLDVPEQARQLWSELEPYLERAHEAAPDLLLNIPPELQGG